MRVGIDIVELPRLKKMMAQTPGIIGKWLTLDERGDDRPATIAGRIAAKEAIVKTGYVKPGDWYRVVITKLKNGAPAVIDGKSGQQIKNLHISISHSEHFAVAVAIYED